MHSVENALHHLFGRTLNVGVFNAEYERATVFASEQPVEQRCSSAAQMEIAGGGWGKAYSDSLCHLRFFMIPEVEFILASLQEPPLFDWLRSVTGRPD
jgi:hypothetical protein